MVLIALLCVLQSTETIPKAHKEPYVRAVKTCKRALELLESEPGEAVALLDSIIENSKVRSRECRLRIEFISGTYAKPYDFFPYQYRGRAHVNLARGDRSTQIRHLEAAEADFEESVRRGLTSSESFLTDVRNRLEALREVPSKPDPRLRWKQLVDAGSFAEALKVGDEFREETIHLCRVELARATDDFLFNLSREDLARLKETEFDRAFALPDQAALVVTTEAYGFALRLRPALRKLDEESLGPLFQAAVDAALMEDPRWYGAVEAIAWRIARSGMNRRIAEAKDAEAERRAVLQSRAEALAGRWENFERRVRSAAKEKEEIVVARDLSARLQEFPEMVVGLQEKLEACFLNDNPQAAFRSFERFLDARDWTRLAIESRRSVATYRAVAAALRGVLEGRAADEITAGLEDWAKRLKQTGVEGDPNRFGPKVAQVLGLLK